MEIVRDGESNAKVALNNLRSFYVALAHADSSGYEVCAHRSDGCTQACNSMAGHGHMKNVQEARKRLTRFFFEDRQQFLKLLERQLYNKNKLAGRTHEKFLVRLNVSSDITWESMIDLHQYNNLLFYDYTKNFRRAVGNLADSKLYGKYRLCYSWSENSVEIENQVEDYLDNGGTVAVCLNVDYNPQAGIKADLPTVYRGRPMIDGDANDNRFDDPQAVWIGLRLKGYDPQRIAGRSSGFAVNLTVDGK